MKSVVFRESLNLFSCKLAGPFVFQGKNKLKALPDFLLDLFAGLGPPFHLLQLFFGHQLAGFFMPGPAALLVFFSGTTWTRVLSIGTGCSKGGGHRSLAARSLIVVHHFVELRSADAVFMQSRSGSAPWISSYTGWRGLNTPFPKAPGLSSIQVPFQFGTDIQLVRPGAQSA